MTKAELLRLIHTIEHLIKPRQIDIGHLPDVEAKRLEQARLELSKVTGTKYP